MSEHGGWRQIATAPRDGTPILVWDPSMASYNWPGEPDDSRYAIGYWRTVWGGGWGNRNTARPAPTHWMPLPEPPEGFTPRPPPPEQRPTDSRGQRTEEG